MAKHDYELAEVSKAQAAPLLHQYHYLTGISKGFKSGYNVGLFHYGSHDPVGVCIFTGFPTPELAVGAFGLSRDDQGGLWELSRLVLHPDYQAEEHNLAGWFMSRAIRMLRRHHLVRAILSYADNDYHSGTVYRATGFTYYGLTAKKKDFWVEQPDGTLVKHSRGPVSGLVGEWRARTQKHRFLKVFDRTLKVEWIPQCTTR
jgi:hypothetical protein